MRVKNTDQYREEIEWMPWQRHITADVVLNLFDLVSDR